MQQAKEKKWVLLGLMILGLIFSFVATVTDIPEGGADNYAHFNISRWAFRYPHLFLDHWGKPVFTILTAPFAQLGMTGVRIFNVAAGLLTAWFCYLLAVELKLKYAWFGAVVAVFTPIYFVMMFTGMTEILFSLFLVISVFLFFRRKYILSSTVISFIFLVRTEGFIFIAIFLTALIIKRQFKALPFLLAGFLIFSLAGGIIYADFLWLVNQIPYRTTADSFYGSGPWYEFFKKMPLYFGILVPVFLLTGTIVLLLRVIRGNNGDRHDAFIEFILIAGTFWSYFLAHAFLWWQGISSAGLVRVMAGVSPVVAVLAIVAIDAIKIRSSRSRILTGILVAASLYMSVTAAEYYQRLLRKDPTQAALKNAALVVKKAKNRRHRLVVHNPQLVYLAGKDPWDFQQVQYGFPDNEAPEHGLPDSTIFIWDAHFSAYEGEVPLDRMLDNPHFEVIGYFDTERPFRALGGLDYQIVIFRKIGDLHRDNHAVLSKLKEGMSTQ
jgi:hypothetical protein